MIVVVAAVVVVGGGWRGKGKDSRFHNRNMQDQECFEDRKSSHHVSRVKI